MPAPFSIVILTGAGLSAESGLATFRDKDGIWARYDYREVATPEGFMNNPDLVHEFYNLRRRDVLKVRPNAAHVALARLERQHRGSVTVITQNVDPLHEAAGTENLIHMHGELLRALCNHCSARAFWTDDLATTTPCPACARSGGMRPDVVWFGEVPKFLEDIADALGACDLFVSIGTSGSVYPAAGLAAEARALGVPCTELNLEPSENARLFSGSRYGRASEIVPAWVLDVLGGL